jgi:hypothetical protein
MIDPQANNAKTHDRPKNSSGRTAMMPDTTPSQDTIRARAYELYEGRGRESGQQEQDWLRAEQEMRSAQAGLAEER